MYRIDLFSVLASDAKELTKMQAKLNTWLTTGSLKKYEIRTAGEYLLFNVCRIKQQGE